MSHPLFVRPLTEEETLTLTEWCGSESSEQAHRAKVILSSAAGKTAYEIGDLLSAHPDNLKKWIREFNQFGLEGIAVRKRGPQGRFSNEQIAQILALYKQAPRRLGLPFDYWTPQKLANEVTERGIVSSISHVTMRQLLRQFEENQQVPPPPEVTDSPAPSSDPVPPLPVGLIPIPALENFPSLGATPSKVDLTTNLTLDDLLTRGRTLLKRADYSSVCELLRYALDWFHDLSADTEADIRCWLSEAYEGLGRYEEALEVVTCYDDATMRARLSEKAFASTRLRLGMGHSRAGSRDKAYARLNEALRSFREQEDYEGISAAHYGIAYNYCEAFNELKFAQDNLNSALNYEQLITDRRLLARIYLTYGVIKFREGAYSDATNYYQRALQVAQQIEDHRLLGLTLMNLGVVANEFGKFKASAEYHSAALEEFKYCEQVNFLARTYSNLADGLIRLGKWQEADHYLTEALVVAEKLDDRDEKLGIFVTRGELRLLQGRLSESENLLQQALSMMTESSRWVEPYMQRVLGQVYHLDGRTELALKTVRSALQQSTKKADIQDIYRCHLCLGEIHYSLESYDQAEEYLELAKEQIKPSQDLTASGHVQRLEGLLAAARGRYAEAQQHVEASVTIFSRLEDRYRLTLSHFALAKILVGLGELEKGRTLAQNAAKVFAEIGASLDLSLVEAFLESLHRGNLNLILPTNVQRFPAVRHSTSGVSDLLLISRLMEAATSRDLLIQELTSILSGHFEVRRAVIWEIQKEEMQPLSGLSLTEAPSFVPFMRQAQADRRSLPAGHLVHILEDRPPLRTLLWLESAALDKSFDLERLKPYLKQVEMGLEYAFMRSQQRMSSPVETAHSRTHSRVPGFIYSSSAMCSLVDRIQKIRTSDVTVLITGESGTGKELIARAVHAESARKDAVFLPFNCSTTPRDMIDSQLFGHRRGSFTGASSNYVGMIRSADGGTLFLDEIGDMALEVQPKLLRFLQEGEIQPLGETKPLKVDVRVIAATNADLERAVEEGRFREDLFHRLNIIRLHVPALRERKEEIPLLAAHYLEHFAKRDGKRNISFSREALHALTQYHWPGNVRQLTAEMRRVVAYTSDGDIITPGDLSPEITTQRVQPARNPWNVPRAVEPEPTPVFGMPRFSSTGNPAGLAPPAPLPPPGFSQPYYGAQPAPAYAPQPPAYPVSGVNFNTPRPFDDFPGYDHQFQAPSGLTNPARPTLREATDEIERKMILEKLVETGNNVSRTARELGLSRRGLKLKMEQLGIDTGKLSLA
ncbi:MAG: sigma 54-interacting transcriptional regulator [Blastocatellia bacterium]|nr:sigma 54-interacting transcriptional regulator [Blastocatellia bacterium]